MTIRPPFIAGNWKMNLTIPEARELASAVVKASLDLPEAVLVLAPPFTALSEVGKIVAGSPVGLAAQNIFWEEKGAFTGEVSAPMLLDAGCRYAIIGHSERRQHFGETDDMVNKKVRAALKAGLSPILCVGETLAERERNETMARISRQVEEDLRDVDGAGFSRTIIAYEPVWAIGTGRTATPQQAQEVHVFIRSLLAEMYDADLAREMRILYGGSAKADNAEELMAQEDVDGLLVGGASLKAEEFVRIIQAAA
jgi:triosephosphate isomerase